MGVPRTAKIVGEEHVQLQLGGPSTMRHGGKEPQAAFMLKNCGVDRGNAIEQDCIERPSVRETLAVIKLDGVTLYRLREDVYFILPAEYLWIG